MLWTAPLGGGLALLGFTKSRSPGPPWGRTRGGEGQGPPVSSSSQPSFREVRKDMAVVPQHTLVTDFKVQIDVPPPWAVCGIPHRTTDVVLYLLPLRSGHTAQALTRHTQVLEQNKTLDTRLLETIRVVLQCFVSTNAHAVQQLPLVTYLLFIHSLTGHFRKRCHPDQSNF